MLMKSEKLLITMKNLFCGYQQNFNTPFAHHKTQFSCIILTIVDRNCYCHFHLLAIKYDEKTICLRLIAIFQIFDRYILYSSLRVFYNDDYSTDRF